MPGWNGWAALSGQLSGGAPVVGENADGRLEVFAVGLNPPDLELSHCWQDPTATSVTGWSDWASLGAPPGQFMGALAVGENADGRLEVFTRVGLMSAGVVWHIWQDPASVTLWSGWDDLGAPPGGVPAHFLVVGQNGDGRLELFTGGSGGELWHIWQQPAPAGGWSAWSDLGTPAGLALSSLAVGQNADGRLEIFAAASDGALWHIWQAAGSPSGWSGWGSLSAPAGIWLASPGVGRNGDGRLEVFAVGNTGDVWHVWQDPASASGWSGWHSLGAPAGVALHSPTVGENADGRLEAFAFGIGDVLWHIWQDAGTASGWSGWDSLGGAPDGPAGVARNADGRLEVFVEGRTPPGPDELWHRWQVSAGGGWSFVSDWELALAGPARRLLTPAGGAIFARTQAGLARSDDAGATWSAVSLPASPGPVAVDPTDASVLYAAGPGDLFKSSNGGVTWTPILSTPGTPGIGLAVSPADHNLVYLALGPGSGSFQFLRSTNGGASWTLLEGPLPGDLCGWTVLILKPHPTDNQRVSRTSGCYAGRNVPFGDSLNQSADQGATWSALFHPTPLFPSRLVGGSGAAPGRFYLGAHFGAPPGGGRLFRSDDDGATWSEALVFSSGPAVGGLAYAPAAPDRVWAGLNSGVVMASEDGGGAWTELGRAGLGGIEDLAMSLDGQYLYAASNLGVWRLHL